MDKGEMMIWASVFVEAYKRTGSNLEAIEEASYAIDNLRQAWKDVKKKHGDFSFITGCYVDMVDMGEV